MPRPGSVYAYVLHLSEGKMRTQQMIIVSTIIGLGVWVAGWKLLSHIRHGRAQTARTEVLSSTTGSSPGLSRSVWVQLDDPATESATRSDFSRTASFREAINDPGLRSPSAVLARRRALDRGREENLMTVRMGGKLKPLETPKPTRRDWRRRAPQVGTPESAALAGAAPKDTRKPVQAKTYKTRKGDTLSEISQRLLGSSRHWKRIFNANRDKLRKPEHLREGMILTVPQVAVARKGSAGVGAADRAAQNATAKSSSRKAKSPKSYRVARGDTLSSIAKCFYGSTQKWPRIYQANQTVLAGPNTIAPGLRIVIP